MESRSGSRLVHLRLSSWDSAPVHVVFLEDTGRGGRFTKVPNHVNFMTVMFRSLAFFLGHCAPCIYRTLIDLFANHPL